MAALANQIATFLIAQTSLTALGTDLFVGVLPSTVTGTTVVLVRETGGSGGERGFGDTGLRYENPSIQFTARGAADDYATPRALLQEVHDAMATIEAQALSSTEWLTVALLQSPTHLGKDELRRHRWVFNVLAQKEPT
jgi:hypothetical protein